MRVSAVPKSYLNRYERQRISFCCWVSLSADAAVHTTAPATQVRVRTTAQVTALQLLSLSTFKIDPTTRAAPAIMWSAPITRGAPATGLADIPESGSLVTTFW